MQWQKIITVTCLIAIFPLTTALTKNNNFLSSQSHLAQNKWQYYQNSRFGFELEYPNNWDESQESQRADGAVLLDKAEGTIRIYANLMTQQTKTPHEWSQAQIYETLTLPNGEQGLFAVREQGKETKAWFFVYSGDKYYNLRAEGSSSFVNQHLDILRQVAKGLTITQGEDGLGSSLSELESLEVTPNKIRAKDGSKLLHIDDVPRNISVDDKIEFGAATRFKQASLAPDQKWLAVTTTGGVHDAAWLVKLGKQEPKLYPVEFGFESTIKIDSWSHNSQYVALTVETPAPQRLISIANRKKVGETVADSETLSVRLPQHEDEVPRQVNYQPLEWRNGELVFDVNGEQRYRFDPKTEQVQIIP